MRFLHLLTRRHLWFADSGICDIGREWSKSRGDCCDSVANSLGIPTVFRVIYRLGSLVDSWSHEAFVARDRVPQNLQRGVAVIAVVNIGIDLLLLVYAGGGFP